ncbi:unnamed protein product, partial [Iphiclides podalirius]
MKSQGARSRQPTEREVAATPNRSSFSSGRLTRGGAARQTTSALVPVREKQARCQACGRQHSTSTCKFRLYTCRVCNKEGHLMKVCPKYRSGQVCAQPVKRLEETSSGEDTDEEIREEDSYNKALFTPSGGSDVAAQGSEAQSWKPGPAPIPDWRAPEPWKLPQGASKEQHASILHHKQALTSEGSFRFEYASDNGLAAGEVIEPDGSRVGAYQYKDPSGQLVKLKYRAGKEGFQILEGSHLPQSPYQNSRGHQSAYDQQRRQPQPQQAYSQQRLEPNQDWTQTQGQGAGGQQTPGGQYYIQSWKPNGKDDGQYHDNDVLEQNKGPHSFGEGYAFAFKG